ncbi:bromo adjacent homology domain-containing 1 protein-like isoform X2 [Paramacrobiotus metropolitanus]|uniref:bromo adjacent homology domain-containing 1 protein-like isoform X2 n=1 Tax=Paramacrobiotus metropolitanus TaxID=2943436 RepID=UPI002445D9E2|nr:bromo adjacent homology domain-containing 1 protein-like isoform X2 [Paramacrobiotus metropolitanus]XP_055335032.1 bromo adjacent homology domain-containing 1 protein-like isoform X2 [Paramacrobiotus metropolitanus]XP_055335039.1 bromo adjacent homology domain-containing 1 protein-like isoform X2 [Paramacrobiotus metropolitanus]
MLSVMARRERDARREASLNASAKMQLILTRPDDANVSIDNALPSPRLSSQGKDLPKHVNGRRSTPDETQEVCINSVPTIVVDDPVSRTIDEVIARSVQLVDRLAEPVAPAVSPAIPLVNGNRRKQASPRQRYAAMAPKVMPSVIPAMPSTGAAISPTRKSKSKSPLIANGPQIVLPEITSPSASGHLRGPLSSDATNDLDALADSNPCAAINGVTAAYLPLNVVTSGKSGHAHALTVIKTNERDDSPTRYFLAVPDSSDGMMEAPVHATTSSPVATRKNSPAGRAVDNAKRKRSTSRTPTNPAPVRKEKLANLLKKRKPPPTPESPVATPSSSSRSAGANGGSRSLTQKKLRMRNGTAVEEERPATRRRKLDTIIAKKGERTVWSWRGRSFEKTVYSEAHKCNIQRTCYHAVKHYEGEVIKVGDCVHLRAGKGQKPHVGKIAAFWDDEKGDMMMTIFWYWRPEEVETNMRPNHGEMEVYVSNLRDENHVGCIDEKCYVLTLHQYACFLAQQKEDSLLYRRPKERIVPETKSLLLDDLPDDDTDLDLVYFADKGYDGKHKRFWRYYFRGNRLRKFVSDSFS